MDHRKMKKEIESAQNLLFEISEAVENHVWAVAIEDGDPEAIKREIWKKVHELKSQAERIHNAYTA